MSANTEPMWIDEEVLAKRLGVDRHTVKQHRPHAPGGGIQTSGKAIQWSGEAAQWLAARLKVPGMSFVEKTPPPATGAPGAVVKNAPPALPEGVEELQVVSKPVVNGRHFANPNLIRCRRAAGEEVLVRVLDSGKYQPQLADGSGPMTVRAKKALGGNWWDLISREPRWRGRP